MKKKAFSTKCVQGWRGDKDTTGAISIPIYQSATFVHDGLGKSSGYDYSRLSNPTREHLEKTLADLESGIGAIAFSTGMGAISCLMTLFQPGDHIIASADLYGGSHRLFRMVSMSNGIEFDFLHTGHTEEVKKLIKPNTKGIYVESPTNPMMQVTDIEAVAAMAAEGDLMLMVDNTFMTPYLQNPIELGADVVIHSATKYLGGHNDTLAGLLVVKDAGVLEQLRVLAKTLGACLSPFDSWLILRGMKTLPLRMDRQETSAQTMVNWLQERPWVKKVYYPGLDNAHDRAILERQSRGCGAMISFEVDESWRVKRILDGVKVISFAESLGGVESLITYPMTQTHADVPEDERLAKGINDRLLRLSVGIEDVNDLIDDLAVAAEGE